MLTSNFKYLLKGLFLSLLIPTHAQAAAVFDPSTVPVYVIAPYAISDSDVGDGTSNTYRPWFENGSWQGDLIEYNVSSAGRLSTTVDSSVQPPTTTGGNWSARIQFDAAVSASSTYWNTGRKIIFHNGTTQKAFIFDNLSATQQAALSSDNLDYVRGDESNEADQNNGTLRQRYNLLGDIIHSNPVYIEVPDGPFASLAGYSAFKSTHASRAARVYVGANDGMLHAFEASSGNEVWAYVPSMLLNTLDKLTAIPFTHTYYVDGQLAEGDMDFDSDAVTYEWHSILAGGLGSGAKGFFALDISYATLSSQTSTADNDQKILFELDGTDADIGYIYGKAQIARLTGDKWRIISGNGYGSDNGKAVLIIMDKDGNVTKIATDNTSGNGLSTPTLVDIDNDFTVDYAYAGDLQGNLWKFDLRDLENLSSTKLYAAGSDKPITTAPDIRRHPNSGRIIYFGTGSLLSATDSSNTSTQSIFAIWDGYTGGDVVIEQTLTAASYTYNDGTNDITLSLRTNSNIVINWADHKGWQVDLNVSGERLVTRPIIRADRLQFVTHNPLTGTHGDAWLLQLNYLNGGAGSGIFLDLNNDGSLTSADKVNDEIPVGINLGNGSFSVPMIARVSNSRDTMFINGLFLAYTEACSEDCSFQGGSIDVTTDSLSGAAVASTASDSYCFSGGDRSAGIPVDTNGDELVSPFTGAASRVGGTLVTGQATDGLAGEVDGFVESYDVIHGQVYVDLINLEPLCSQSAADGGGDNELQDLARITEVGINYDKSFFVILANADFSPGSYLQIGSKKWNVVVYQKLIQVKLDAWVAAGSNTSLDSSIASSFAAMMVDDDGDTLLYSINSIMSADSNTGTLRHSFDSLSIISGGLFPTQRACFMDEPEVNINTGSSTQDTGRWRGGALVTQLIGVTEYLTDTGTVVKQNPSDLYRKRTIDDVDIELKLDTTNDGNYDTFYGGLRARYRVDGNSANAVTANAAFLYESTMHWEFSGPCYGTANWQAFVNGAANSSSTTALHSQIAILDLLIEAAELALKALEDAGERASTIARQQTLIDKLTLKRTEILEALDDSSIENTGTPTAPTNINSVISPSLGPNFTTGRRTWIDLTP